MGIFRDFQGLGLLFRAVFPIRSLTLSLETPVPSLRSLSSAPVTSKLSAEDDSSIIQYLISSCGLSSETAVSTSRKVRFRSTEKPDQVLSLLRAYAFSEDHISNIIRKCPAILVAKPEATLLPKLQFFLSIGMSKTDLANIISRDPSLLTRSLEKQIQPSYSFLKSVLLTDEKIVSALKRTTWFCLKDMSSKLIPNVSFLRELGVPQNCISLLLSHFPETLFMQTHEEFCKIVEEAKEMGFEPKKSTFVLALHNLSGKGNKLVWDRSFEVYKNWGWSRDDILEAFRHHPHCMMLSEKNIVDTMNFFVNKMGFPSRSMAKRPTLLCYSLEKRIIPRCSVIQVLLAKGLIKEDPSLSTVLQPSEKGFLKRYVTKYEDEVPQLLDLYRGEVDLQSLTGNFRGRLRL